MAKRRYSRTPDSDDIVVDANLEAELTLYVPHGTEPTLNGGDDLPGAIFVSTNPADKRFYFKTEAGSWNSVANLSDLENYVQKVSGKGLSTEDYTTAEKSKLASLSNYYKGVHVSLAALSAAIPSGNSGEYAVVDPANGTDSKIAIWDANDVKWVIASGSGNVLSVNGQTGAVSLSTDNIGEGSNPARVYFTDARSLATVITGISTATNAAVVDGITIVQALGRLQAQSTANATAIATEVANRQNADTAIVNQLVDGANTDNNTLNKLATRINGLAAIVGSGSPDADNIVNTVAELLAVFQNYPEGTDIFTLLSDKFNSADVYNALDRVLGGKALDARQGKALKDLIDAANSAISTLQSQMAGKADDSTVVHKTGDENIGGNKNFTGRNKFPWIDIDNTTTNGGYGSFSNGVQRGSFKFNKDSGNFQITFYDDLGNFRTTSVSIDRLTGDAYFERDVYAGGVKLLPGTIATDAETQITASVAEDNKVVSRLKLFNWWTWLKGQVQNITGNWSFSGRIAAGTSTVNNAWLTLAASTASFASFILNFGAAYTGNVAGAIWGETNKRVRAYRDTADDFLFNNNNFILKNGNTLNGLMSSGATGDIAPILARDIVIGNATLVAGAISVSNVNITTMSEIFITPQDSGTFNGRLRVSTKASGSFTVTSSDSGDTVKFSYMIINP